MIVAEIINGLGWTLTVSAHFDGYKIISNNSRL